MPEPSHDQDGQDTSLARALHQRSAAPVEVLQASLAEARRRRALGGASEEASLAAVITERALVAPTVLAEAARAASASSSGRLGASWSGERPLRASTEQSGERLAGSGTGTNLVPEPSAGPPPDAFALPAQLGAFRLRRELARGGMGAVWEVEHIESGGLYALKTILAAGRLQGPGGEAMARFRREAELGARLDHPHVVRVHSADLEADPPWLVQTYLTGGSLDERLKRQGPLPLEEAASIVAKVARGLAHAHAKGVLHRDLKPPNVLFDAEGEPRVVDFGVARSLREGTLRLTATGEVLGSPAYMAPEQALGEKEVDARADVHALGALLFACLTGGPPFAARAMLEVIEQVISRPAPAPSASRPGVPPALDAVVLRCMEKDPAARFQTADEVAAALEAWLAPAEAPRRTSALVGVLGALAVAAVGALAVALVARGRRAQEPPPPPPSTSEALVASPTVTAPPAPVIPADWLATFEAAPKFGIAWQNVLDGAGGGLALTFERQGPVEVEGEALRLRLKVTRLAYAASIGGGTEGVGTLNSMRFDSADDADAGGDVPAGLGGAMARAMRHVRSAVGRDVELRLLRSSGAVLRFEGLPSPPRFEPEERREMTGGLCERLTRYVSDDNVGRCLDNVLRLLPDAAGVPATRTIVPHYDLGLTASLVLTPVTPGSFTLGLGDGPPPVWSSRIDGESASPKRDLTITGLVLLEGGRVVDSVLDARFWTFDADPRNGERKMWRSRRSRFRWAPGEPDAPRTEAE